MDGYEAVNGKIRTEGSGGLSLIVVSSLFLPCPVLLAIYPFLQSHIARISVSTEHSNALIGYPSLNVIDVEIHGSRDALKIVLIESIKAVHVCSSATRHEPAEQTLPTCGRKGV